MGLRKNDRIPLQITAVTAEGSGIGRYEGLAVFVPGAAAGDEITAHIVKVKSNCAFARLDTLHKPSPDREDPACAVFPACGGCAFRHISYEAELRVKQNTVKDALKRIGHIDLEPEPILAALRQQRYRNKAQYPVEKKDNQLKIGFYAQRSHRVQDCRSCLLQPEEFDAVLEIFARWIEETGVSVYDEETKQGLLRHIYLRRGGKTGEIMVCAVVNGDSLPRSGELTRELAEKVPGIKSIVLNSNRADTNVILGERTVTLWGRDFITDELCGLEFRISPLSFYQVNPAGAEILYRKAAEFAGLTGTETVLDLYCGAGTIGLTMAAKAKEIIGVEIVPQAVEDARTNAQINGIRNARFLCADASEAARVLAGEDTKPDVILLDPPRKGCVPALLHTIAGMAPERIVYVSCDPATLARDCAILNSLGYTVKKAAPVDMFPRTGHVETVVLITRKND